MKSCAKGQDNGCFLGKEGPSRCNLFAFLSNTTDQTSFPLLNVFISFSFQAMVSEIAPSVYLRLCYLNTIVSESVPSMGGY